jgi:hypothetical protein
VECTQHIRYEYVKLKFVVNDKQSASPINVSGDDLIAPSKMDAAEDADVNRS